MGAWGAKSSRPDPDKSFVTPVWDFMVVSPGTFSEITNSAPRPPRPQALFLNSLTRALKTAGGRMWACECVVFLWVVSFLFFSLWTLLNIDECACIWVMCNLVHAAQSNPLKHALPWRKYLSIWMCTLSDGWATCSKQRICQVYSTDLSAIFYHQNQAD